ncbi:DUF1304 domain-containing protein [Kibdelosporangium philippinense]|uniref:DUF1304 domain-containing protein n=1 Tax=Kibdelosporangium philippinense TaxID=211113 RepID=A0ABS8Z1N0_9PSEU|nr:DUF1304 domain-containing protein [Kibdelosporangium philippinense]MCE7001849.1 DUF1304 domain-containing protein [Kibdelosporangium philippinense]
MTLIATVFAGIAALVHIIAFAWETVLFRREGVHWGVFKIRSEDVPAVLLWSFNQGFYNLFLAAGTVFGLVSVHSGNVELGRAFVFYTCGFMVLSGTMLFISNRLGLGREKDADVWGPFGQGVPPLVAIIAMLA